MGDIMHMQSGVIAVELDALVLGHKLFDSGAERCAPRWSSACASPRP